MLVLLVSVSAVFATGTKETPGVASAGNRSIKLVIQSEPLSADPNDMERGDALVFKGNVCQSLTDIDPITSNVTPLLATSWDQVDPYTWVFHLREGVTFQDGTPFNADAVVFSVNRALNTSEISNTDKAKVAEDVTPSAVDPLTVKLTTTVPAPSLPREMAFVHMSSSTATPAKAKTDYPVGTGPYKFVEWERGQYITVERWDGYWGDQPEVEKATVVFRGEPSIRAHMITNRRSRPLYFDYRGIRYSR